MAAPAPNTPNDARATGGSFLLQPVGTFRQNTPEDFSEDQRAFYKTALQFSREQVLPNAERIESKDAAYMRELLGRAGETGLLMLDVPEAHGGLGADKTSSMLVAEASSLLASFGVTLMAHTGIGSLPIAWFGSPEQKAKYLPELATGQKIAAYALTEQGSGSDALGAKTRAVRAEDGSWRLTGSKLFITNSAFGDVFTVFAKVDGEKFSAFIVERDTPGFSIGPEERKMGIRGSSTCPLYLEDAIVPASALLGEIGRGHKIAFNILNLGRMKLAPYSLGSMKEQLGDALRFAAERKQFGVAILTFPLIREKLARMAAWTYAIESMVYRTSGLVDARLAAEGAGADDGERIMAAFEEYAIEASIMKVAASEALDMLVDEAVQIHGGAGFIEDYPVERAYRDSRINRLFEGTNEINRMLITGMLLKRAAKGDLPLEAALAEAEAAVAAGKGPKARVQDGLSREEECAEALKQLALVSLSAGHRGFGAALEKQQDVLATISYLVMDAYAVESAVVRTRQAAKDGALDEVRVALVKSLATEVMSRGLERARKALCASLEGEALQSALARLAPLLALPSYRPQTLRETIVTALETRNGELFPYV